MSSPRLFACLVYQHKVMQQFKIGPYSQRWSGTIQIVVLALQMVSFERRPVEAKVKSRRARLWSFCRKKLLCSFRTSRIL